MAESEFIEEVEDELVDLPEGDKGIVGKEDTLRLIELGVRLGIRAAAEWCAEHSNPGTAYFIRAINPAGVIRRRP